MSVLINVIKPESVIDLIRVSGQWLNQWVSLVIELHEPMCIIAGPRRKVLRPATYLALSSTG